MGCMSMYDKDFKEKFAVHLVKLRKGFYDVLMGNRRVKIGHVCFSYGQWCFCPVSGDNWYYGDTRCSAVWAWMKSTGAASSEEVQQ